ncbi:UPF0587 [Hibiscus syriacus]|uniref:UPF0587 n=1 Tax=Hibiscus syriacus TaxID=106335 RepID=A0A6A2WU29_HIBSY|nr:UPF0587 [Hibiscus syriacus]
MQTRSGSVGSLEEGKEPVVTTRATQFKTPPLRSVITTVKSNFVTCDEKPDNSLDRWRKPPSNLLHSMSDKELFWRASFAPRIKKYPFRRVPKIAFMFLTKGPLPLSPLWERFLMAMKAVILSMFIHCHRSRPSFHHLPCFTGDISRVRCSLTVEEVLACRIPRLHKRLRHAHSHTNVYPEV